MNSDRLIEDRLSQALAQTAARVVPDEDVPPALTVPASVRAFGARRYLPLLAAAAVVLAVVGSWVAVRALRDDSPTRPGPKPAIQPGPTPAVIDPRSAPLRNATIEIPAFAKAPSGICQGGRRKFTDDVATAGRSGGSPYRYYLWVPPEPRYVRYGMPVWGDLDGKPGDEVLVEVSCEGGGSVHPSQLLALAPQRNGSYRTLGVVNRDAQDGGYLLFDPATVRLDGRTILLDVRGPEVSNGLPMANQQTRGYRYQDGKFVQVSGPTTFPPLATNAHDLDPRNATVLAMPLAKIGQCDQCPGVYAAFTDGRAHAIQPTQQPDGTFLLSTYDFRVDASTVMTMGTHKADILLVTVTQRVNGGPARQVVYEVDPSDGFQISQAWPVIWTGENGVIGIAHVSGAGGVARIVVRTSSGEQTRAYTTKNHQTWTRTR